MMIDGTYDMSGDLGFWNIGNYVEAINFGRTYLQSERDDSWKNLKELYIQDWFVGNFCYYGHGSPGSIGGDQNIVDSGNNVTGSTNFPGSHAYLTSQWVHDNVTFNKSSGAQPYRFVFLDGCNTAATNSTWPWAWGVPNEAKDLTHYQGTNSKTGARPAAFIGWETKKLSAAFDDARDFAGWFPGKVNAHLKKYGYTDMGFKQYNQAGDWP